ncbi:hypothetical protein DL771_005036 [Monosporascus sp. 5C6A]|nr:hypothetical protein DL771_005036 [Monosporascus sp. 5C6A]
MDRRAPFDTGTTYRPGAQFGASGIPRPVEERGGDYTITLPLLRSVTRAYCPVSVITCSHLDTRRPKAFSSSPSEAASINHGTYFYHAAREGLLANDSNAREIDGIGSAGIVRKFPARVGTTNPVYLSLDIDTLDPVFGPATGRPETGGWSTRELRAVLRGLEDPAYDANAEHTMVSAADALYEIMSIMLKARLAGRSLRMVMIRG